MKHFKRLLFTLSFLVILMVLGSCTDVKKEKQILFPTHMTETEKSKISTVTNEFGDGITLFDEEIGASFEIQMLKSGAYNPSEPASLYLIQGTIFNGSQLSALKGYLDANAPQTLLAIMNNGDAGNAGVDIDMIKNAKAYEAFIMDNLMGWICENYQIKTNDICFTGFETGAALAAYMLHNVNSVVNYLLISPEMHKKIDGLTFIEREEVFFTEENTSLHANLCLLRSEEDYLELPFLKTNEWVLALTERDYKEFSLHDEILSGVGHNTMNIEALLRGICYYSNRTYGDPEEACVDASKKMTEAERDSITFGKLSADHEFYNEIIGMDPGASEYIQEIVMMDEEIGDRFVIHLSLPPDYDESRNYPLVLMTDGVWRLSDHPELRKLMISGEIEPVILASVGYPNGYDYFSIRERDLLQQPDLYLQFLVDNLVPTLCEIYPIDTEKMTLTGHSYGGYWGMYALLHSDTLNQDVFANYYIGSPSFQANTNSVSFQKFEEMYYKRNKELNCNVYVTVGGDEEPFFIDMIEQNIEAMKNHAYGGLSLEYEVIEGHDHNTVFKPSIRNALKKFYSSY